MGERVGAGPADVVAVVVVVTAVSPEAAASPGATAVAATRRRSPSTTARRRASSCGSRSGQAFELRVGGRAFGRSGMRTRSAARETGVGRRYEPSSGCERIRCVEKPAMSDGIGAEQAI